MAGGRGFGDRGTSFTGGFKSLRSRPLSSHKGSVAGFTGYRLCRRPPIFSVLLYCVVLCCRRDGLGSIYTKRIREPNGTTETKEPNRTTETDGTIGTTDPNGTAPLWLCGFVALWRCGFAALWLYGSAPL